MRKSYFKASALCAIMVMVLGTGLAEGQTQPPPVVAPLVREGAFAMKLALALTVGHPSSEVEAESMLGVSGIAPRNGWIADYPVTPDIIGELRDSVAYAAQAKTISMDQDTALKTLESVQASVNVSVSPGPAGPPEPSTQGTTQSPPTGESGYPDQAAINSSYYQEGPPIMTYYQPPPDYYYLYSWVPYPFWWGGFWFGGFFILHDFHRHFREDGHVFVVTNHFNDVRAHRVFRVDPVNRFNGKTFAGIGAPRSNNFISTRVQRQPERVFNGGPSRSSASSSTIRTVRPQSSTAGTVRQPSARSYRAVNPFTASRVYSRPPGAGRTFTPHSDTPSGGTRVTAPTGGTRGDAGGMRK